MSIGFSSGVLVERWSLDLSDIAFVSGVPELAQLGFAIQLKFFTFSGRTARRHCSEILQHLGFRRLRRDDREQLTSWISDELCPSGQSGSAVLEHVLLWCRDRRIYGPSLKELERLVRSQRQHYLESWLGRRA